MIWAVLFLLGSGFHLFGQDLESFAIDQESGIVIQQVNEGNASVAPLFFITDNVRAAQTISTDKVRTGGELGYELSGAGMEVAIWDAGAVRISHQEFDGRVSVGDNPSYINDTHATHVAGTICASGLISEEEALGMAPEVQLVSHDWNNDAAEVFNYAQNGGMISNHSYGLIRGWHYNSQEGMYYWFGDVFISETEDANFGRYDNLARSWDNLAYQNPHYLIVKSAGNDRSNVGPPDGIQHYYFENGNWNLSSADRDSDGIWDCLGHNAVSKNILVVGSIHDMPDGYTNPGAVILSSFSSSGPTDDGRIKPDLVGNGLSLKSTDGTGDDQYSSKSGTSMSSPTVAGSAVLLQEQAMNELGSYMTSAELRALMIHSCDEAGNTEGPDYAFGWGVLNTATAATVIDESKDGHHDIFLETLENDEVFEYTFYSDGSEPLKATIAWTDPAGNPLSYPYDLDDPSPMLVNDLDLRLIYAETGEELLPYKLSASQPDGGAIKSDNSVDNVEQVFEDNPVAGFYTVRVSHKGNLTNDAQEFALILSGKGQTCPETPEFTYLTDGFTVYFELSNFDTETVIDVFWDFGDGLMDGGWDPDKTHLFYNPGEFEVCVTYSPSDAEYCAPTTKCEIVEIVDPEPCGPQPEVYGSEYPAQNITALAAGENGTVLAYRNNELLFFNGDIFVSYDHSDMGLSPDATVWDVVVVSSDEWLIATSEGLINYDGNNFTKTIENPVIDLARSPDSDLWILTQYEAFQLDGFDLVPLNGQNPDFRSMTISEEGIAYFATQTGLWSYELGSGNPINQIPPQLTGITSSTIIDVHAASNGHVYVLGDNNIVAIYSNGQWSNPSLNNHLVGSDDLTDLEADTQGNLYIGASPGGINWLENNQWSQLGLSELTGGYDVEFLSFSDNGDYWFSTGDELVFIPEDHSQEVSFEVPASLCSNASLLFFNTSSTENLGPNTAWYINDEFVSADFHLIHTLEEGFYWIRLEMGEGDCIVTSEIGIVIKNCAKESGCDPGWITDFYPDICPDLQVGSGLNQMAETENGDFYLVGSNTLKLQQQDDLWYDLIDFGQTNCVLADQDDFVFIGAENVIYHTNGSEINSFDHNSDSTVFPEYFSPRSIAKSSNGDIYIAYLNESSLTRFVNGEWNNYETTPELPAANVSLKMCAGTDNQLFIASDHQIHNVTLGNSDLIVDLLDTQVGDQYVTDMIFSAGALWMSTASYLIRYSETTGLDIYENVDENVGYITGLASANNQSGIWVSGYNRISYFENGQVRFEHSNPDGVNNFQFLDRDSAGVLWTSNGEAIVRFEPPVLLPNIVAPAGTICAGIPVTFTTDYYDPEMEYLWEANGQTGSYPDFEIAFTGFGEYTVSLTITDPTEECAISNTVTVIVDEDCVFPGDVDKDGFVGLLDVLMMGTAAGQTGPARPNASWDFVGQACENWDFEMPGGINAKHADTQGNGMVQHEGIHVIEQNYQMATEGLSFNGPGGADIYLDGPQFLLPDTPYAFAINAGTEEAPLPYFYGAAVSVHLTGVFDDVIVNFSESIFEESDEYFTFVKKFDDRVDVAVYTTDPEGINNAHGEIFRVTTIMVVDNVSDDGDDVIPFDISIQNLTLLDTEFDVLSLGAQELDKNGALYLDPVLPPLVNEGNAISTCDNDPLFLKVAPNMMDYIWFYNNEVIEGAKENIYFATESGSYRCEIIGPDEITLDPVHWEVEYNPIMKPSVIQNENMLRADGIGETYEWFYNGGVIPFAHGKSYVATEKGYYAVRISNQAGCTSISNSVFVDGENPFESTGIESTSESGFDVYPNPFVDDLTIEIPDNFESDEKLQVQVFDLNGRLIYSNKLASGTQTISLRDIPAGVYQMELSNRNHSYSKQVIKHPNR